MGFELGKKTVTDHFTRERVSEGEKNREKKPSGDMFMFIVAGGGCVLFTFTFLLPLRNIYL